MNDYIIENGASPKLLLKSFSLSPRKVVVEWVPHGPYLCLQSGDLAEEIVKFLDPSGKDGLKVVELERLG